MEVTITFLFWKVIPFVGIIAVIGIPLYFILGILFAIKKSKKLKDLLYIFISFPIIHYGYGLGYLLGIVNFLIMNNKPSKKLSRLTR